MQHMKPFKILLLFLLVITSLNTFSQTHEKTNCTVLKDCKLQYFEIDNTTTYIIIKGPKFVEYIDGGKNYIKSDLEWINECEYKATITEITVPNTPYKIGDFMTVKIDRISNKIVYYTATFQGFSFTGKFKIIT